MNRLGRRWAGLVRAGLVAAAALLAAVPRAGAADFRLTLENDHFNFWQKPGNRPDFGYTHGTEFAMRLPCGARGLPPWLPQRWLAGAGGDAALEFRIRQDIYSPWNLYNPERNGPDRIYAGWLGVSAGASFASARSRRELLLLAGVTGPPSLASAVQREMHRTFDQGTPPDWSDQLPSEPAVGLEASSVTRTLWRGREDGGAFAIATSWLVRVATYSTTAQVGLSLGAGWRTPAPEAGTGPAGPGPRLHLKLEPRAEWVGRDEFLDGTLFRDHPGPGARRWVVQARTSLGAGWGPLGLEYSVVRRSREFDGQPKPHTYSSLSARWTR